MKDWIAHLAPLSESIFLNLSNGDIAGALLNFDFVSVRVVVVTLWPGEGSVTSAKQTKSVSFRSVKKRISLQTCFFCDFLHCFCATDVLGQAI